MAERLRALLCLVGVVLLTACWVVAGVVTDGFDPVRQSISQLQRDGSGTAAVMTAAFAAFAVGAVAFAPLLPRLPRAALLLAGVATVGAALSPLGEVRGGRQDALHLAFGATGYVSLSLLPLLAARSLRGRPRALSLLAGAVTSGCLLGTVPADAVSGVLQRAGFLSAHLWLAGAALGRLRA
jgi:MFS family permease